MYWDLAFIWFLVYCIFYIVKASPQVFFNHYLLMGKNVKWWMRNWLFCALKRLEMLHILVVLIHRHSYTKIVYYSVSFICCSSYFERSFKWNQTVKQLNLCCYKLWTWYHSPGVMWKVDKFAEYTKLPTQNEVCWSCTIHFLLGFIAARKFFIFLSNSFLYCILYLNINNLASNVQVFIDPLDVPACDLRFVHIWLARIQIWVVHFLHLFCCCCSPPVFYLLFTHF